MSTVETGALGRVGSDQMSSDDKRVEFFLRPGTYARLDAAKEEPPSDGDRGEYVRAALLLRLCLDEGGWTPANLRRAKAQIDGRLWGPRDRT